MALRALILLLATLAWTTAGAADFGDPGARMRVYWLQGRLVVGVYPRPNEGYIQLARRVMEQPADYGSIAAFNKGRPPQTGRPVNFPIVTLKPHLRGQALRALYPDDELTERGWSHRVTDPLENLIQLSEAYTGSKGRFKELARYNQLADPDVLRQGTEIVIPLHWIPEGLGFRPLSVKAPLKLRKGDRSGRIYAAYRVRRNDTLYSLLLRFTDRERAGELKRMSRLLMEINGIAGELRLPAGRTLRLPIEWISEDHLVSGFGPAPRPPPRPRPKRRAGSAPFHVILDVGHGGTDPGAVYGSRKHGDRVYEHEVVYDVSLRLGRLLEAKGYHVYPTVSDSARPDPVSRLSTAALGGERVLVTPRYRMDSPKVAVNLRVFLINALYRRLRKQGVAPENVVLISIHGDALAPTLRGAMVYYPDHRLRASEFAPRGRIYRIRSEAVPGRLLFRRADNRRAQQMSREFGELVVKAFRANGLRVSPRKAVRSYYYREGERTLPAVLRYSQVPTSVLVEVANLNNRADRRALLKAANRQKVAAGLAAALDYLRYSPGPRVARRKAS